MVVSIFTNSGRGHESNHRLDHSNKRLKMMLGGIRMALPERTTEHHNEGTTYESIK